MTVKNYNNPFGFLQIYTTYISMLSYKSDVKISIPWFCHNNCDTT